jgi:non-canonical (house-cleaning) NTP pyrophosphatase
MADSETVTVSPTVEVPPAVIEQVKQSVAGDDPEQVRDYLFDRVEVSPVFVDPDETAVEEELTDGSD